MRVLTAYGSSGGYQVTQMAKTEKQYNNTKVLVLDSWFSVLLAALGVRIGGGPPAAGGRLVHG